MPTAREFLDFWTENSVHPAEHFGALGASQALPDLIRRCEDMAAAEGLSRQDLEAEVGDLGAFIADKLSEANNAERDRNAR